MTLSAGWEPTTERGVCLWRKQLPHSAHVLVCPIKAGDPECGFYWSLYLTRSGVRANSAGFRTVELAARDADDLRVTHLGDGFWRVSSHRVPPSGAVGPIVSPMAPPLFSGESHA